MVDTNGLHPLTYSAELYGSGICQPGNTSLYFDGSNNICFLFSGTDFLFGVDDFSIETVIKFGTPGSICLICDVYDPGQLSWIFNKSPSTNLLSFSYSLSGTSLTTISVPAGYEITDTNFHHIVVTRSDGYIDFYIDGNQVAALEFSEDDYLFDSTAPLKVGPMINVSLDRLAIYKGRALAVDEIAERWQVVQGQLNGSNYPEVGYCLGQLWAFYRLAEYFFVSNDAGAWGVLDNWLTWLDTYVVADGAGWKFPIWFHEYGFIYDAVSEFSFDAGAAGSIVVGCLYVYMRNGDSRALMLAQRLLEDLRLYRASGDYGGYLYKSDYHYAWMNALVAHAFGMAIVGRASAAYVYPFTTADETHFQNIMNNFWLMSGDSKPNLLNSDLIPFHDAEPHDIWDYAPDYLFMKEMGSMEGVVLMMHAALDWALYSGSYHWFNVLLEFMIRLGQATLGEQQIYKVNSNFTTTQVATKVNLSYGDYRRDNTLFVEEKDQSMIDLLGEIRTSLVMHYGSPVITEDANTAARSPAGSWNTSLRPKSSSRWWLICRRPGWT